MYGVIIWTRKLSFLKISSVGFFVFFKGGAFNESLLALHIVSKCL